jgi:branched-chain amino acid transport system substrate-binding protein
VAGRGRFRALLPILAAIAVGSVACRPVPGVSDPVPDPALPEIRLERGAVARSEEREAARLLREAELAFAEGRRAEAAVLAGRIVEAFATTAASGPALWIRAQALGAPEQGASQGTALEDVERLLPLLGASDPRRPRAVLLRARILSEAGRTAEALAAALDLPPRDEVTTADFEWARTVAARLDRDAIEEVVAGATPGTPLSAPVLVALAGLRGADGDAPEAFEAARAALAAGAFGPDRTRADALLAGEGIAESTRLAERIPIATILPTSGSPALRRFAESVREGVLAAVTAAELDDRVEVEVYDDAGDAARVGALLGEIEGTEVFGIVGPLQDDALDAAALARSGEAPIVSPTAFTVPGVEGVYSLGNLDPQSARELAAWAASVGIRTVAMVHAADPASLEEAEIFRVAFEGAGGAVVQTLTYPPGQTFFQEQILAVAAARPEALVFPVAPSDVEALAPQVTFYGLDTLGIQVLGTAAWTDEGVRETVSARHLSGVVVASPDLTDRSGYDRFVEAYETRFRRTYLQDPGAEFGYDAASLLLEAARRGARSPRQMAERLEEVEEFAGATGLLSVEGGRLLRRHRVVCYEGADPVPIRPGRPLQRWRAYPMPTETTDTLPPGPGRRDGFACPGTPEARAADSVFFAEGGDTLYPELARIYRANDTLPRIELDRIVPGR